jgi:hypothetical protein
MTVYNFSQEDHNAANVTNPTSPNSAGSDRINLVF